MEGKSSSHHPLVAVVSVPNGTIVHCPEFNLPGSTSTITDTKPLTNIIKNLSITEEEKEIIDMHKELTSNTTWKKLPYVNGEVDALVQHMLSQATEAEKPISRQCITTEIQVNSLFYYSVPSSY